MPIRGSSPSSTALQLRAMSAPSTGSYCGTSRGPYPRCSSESPPVRISTTYSGVSEVWLRYSPRRSRRRSRRVLVEDTLRGEPVDLARRDPENLAQNELVVLPEDRA